MILKRFKLSLFLLAIIACLSCESNLTPTPSDSLGIIDESLLEAVDISFEEFESNGLERFMTEGESCDRLARVRKVRREGDCLYMIELRHGRFVNPINAEDIQDLLRNGAFLKVSLERVEEGPCDRGIPAYVYCASSLEMSRQRPNGEEEEIKYRMRDGN